MRAWKRGIWAAAALSVWLLAGARASAASVRYHYAASDSCGHLRLMSDGPGGAPRERLTWFGLVREADPGPPRPNQLVTFRHPFTGRPVIVPLHLPEGTPRMEYRTTRVIYDYGSYAVEVQFLSDGSVDVIYNSGLLRAL
ncbi:MAG: hypothetical protein JO112_03835 [Planctomycetes bacterium]|nr:hypothetical protein [Planctomycetota bacterium]